MNDISVFDQAGVKADAGAIMCGVRMGLIDPDTICSYAERLILETGDEEGKLTDMLVFEGGDKEAISCMREHGFAESEDSLRRLRYAMLARLTAQGQELLQDVEDVYASLGYPEDMRHLIYYMPSSEAAGSQEELIARFRDFLKSEKEALGI